MDEWVLKTQKWLNTKYADVHGYEPCKENGRTGWNTIYSLREGLQDELGISPVSSGFGPKTEYRLGLMINSLDQDQNRNIVQLIQGAFWCKGISPSAFDGNYTTNTKNAISNLQTFAGVRSSGIMSVPLMKALFDMSAFVLVSGGNAKIRSMQQYLNGNYNAYFGILPCDGIYQRDTNTALIYALQAVENMSPSEANGFYGPGTISRTPVLNPGEHGEGVKVLQYGLLANGFYEGPFDGIFSNGVATSVISFRKFMNLPPITSTADLTVIKGLLTSNGNTSRDSIACDTSVQLNDSQIDLLKQYGFSVVGRYLTGSVGDDRIPKNLTLSEIERITKSGLSIFPIYQDGGAKLSYFTATQGAKDARIARQTALKLGFPVGTTIYFAVDIDIEGGNISSTVLPYIRAVNANMYNFKIGIYGTRNVCAQALKDGSATSCFVSNMSTGYSGNLGFKMPNKWSFDQFIEYSIGSLPIDQVASSGRDEGARAFSKITISTEDALKSLFGDFQVTMEKKLKVIDEGWYSLYLMITNKFSIDGGSGFISIKNGKISSYDLTKYFEKNGDTPKSVINVILTKAEELNLVSKVKNGRMTITSTVKSSSEISTKLTITVYELKDGPLDEALSTSFEANMKIKDLPDGGDLLGQISEAWSTYLIPIATIVIMSIVVALVIDGVAVIGTTGELIALVVGVLEKIAKALGVPGLPRRK